MSNATRLTEAWGRSVLQRAINDGRAAELLERLFDGDSVTIDLQTGALVFASAEQLAAMWSGACPEATEGNGRPSRGTVVDVPAALEEDHVASGQSLDTLTVGQLRQVLDDHDLADDTWIRLSVLGEVIDVAGVEVGDDVRLVGAEVTTDVDLSMPEVVDP